MEPYIRDDHENRYQPEERLGGNEKWNVFDRDSSTSCEEISVGLGIDQAREKRGPKKRDDPGALIEFNMLTEIIQAGPVRRSHVIL
jgi:hypothetical protein